MDAIAELHATLDRRPTTEAVCAIARRVLGDTIPQAHRRTLDAVAQSRPAWYSSMSDDFARPVPLTHKVQMLTQMLGAGDITAGQIAELANDPWKLRGEVRKLGMFLGWHTGTPFTARTPYNALGTAVVAAKLSRRQRNRVVRLLIRTAAAAASMQEQIMLRHLLLVSRGGLVHTITLDDFRRDPAAACFVAYFNARKNQRRRFTLASRDNPYDEIAAMLLSHCKPTATNWDMVARVWPTPIILARLTAGQRGVLLGTWTRYMRECADRLKTMHSDWMLKVDLARMVVQPGIDSSRWNTVAGAYNAARAAWINLLSMAGMPDLLDVFCPGKAMRFMAADLVAMHDGQVDPQTAVWAALPLPWQVISGEADCTRMVVERICRERGVDPEATGWTAPRQNSGAVAAWQPTPELVHGIEVQDPLWAGLLRRSGAFSGKPQPGSWSPLTEPVSPQ